MNILVVGSGGREHALVHKIAESRNVEKVFCAPGNAGIAAQAECVDIKADDIDSLADFAASRKIALTVVGPEGPLAKGIVDKFDSRGLKAFGPTKAAAKLESSKIFAKNLMKKYGVPTAGFEVFEKPGEAKKYVRAHGAPVVIKADGLAAGKGVTVAQSVEEACRCVELAMEDRVFGEAGNRVIVEECLNGEEASILVLANGTDFVPLSSSQDHKRVFDSDQGPNTGGMGAYSPAPVVTDGLFQQIMDTVIFRTLDGLKKEGVRFTGVLYAGIMVTQDGPKVLEFNARYGDPETQALLPRLRSDVVELMLSVMQGGAGNISLDWDDRSCVCVAMTSGGYPGKYEKGRVISGLEDVSNMKDVVVFHAGTSFDSRGNVVTAGGRVLGVTALGSGIKAAIALAYGAVRKISFEDAHFRTDIGKRAL